MERATLSPEEAAERHGVSIQTLANWRHLRRGPAYCRPPGSRLIRYWIEDLDAFFLAGRIDPEADSPRLQE